MISTDDYMPHVYDVGSKVIIIPEKVGGKLNIEPKISDLGLAKKINDHDAIEYGVISYLPPEALLQKPYTKASDIYSFGAIMSEMSTGKPPFENRIPYCNLKLEIINGLRPEFAPGTPNCYIELANQCMNSNPEKRPTAANIYEKLQDWEIILDKDTEELNKKELEIKDAFLEADKIIQILPINNTININNQNDKYSSQFIGSMENLYITSYSGYE